MSPLWITPIAVIGFIILVFIAVLAWNHLYLNRRRWMTPEQKIKWLILIENYEWGDEDCPEITADNVDEIL